MEQLSLQFEPVSAGNLKQCSSCQGVKSLDQFRYRERYSIRFDRVSQCYEAKCKKCLHEYQSRRLTVTNPPCDAEVKVGAFEGAPLIPCPNLATSATSGSPWCHVHQKRYKKGLPMDAPFKRFTSRVVDEVGNRLCWSCGYHLPESEYSNSLTAKSGKTRDCKVCTRASKYSLTRRSLTALFDAQNWQCAACREPITLRDGPPGLQGPGAAHIDHDHECCPGRRSCGRCVRGLLCEACNLCEGHMKTFDKCMGLAAYMLKSANVISEPRNFILP